MRQALAASLFFLLFTGCVTPASQMEPAGPDPQPMEAANRVLIRTQDTPKEAYKRIARILQSEGYTLGNTDETLLTMTTEWQEYQGAAEMKVTAIVDEQGESYEGTTVTLQGKQGIRMGGGLAAESAGSEIQNSGQSNSPMKNAFKELQKIASQYGGSEVAYARN